MFVENLKHVTDSITQNLDTLKKAKEIRMNMDINS